MAQSHGADCGGEDGVVGDDRDAYLDAVLIGGQEPTSIVVVSYDDA